MVLTAYETLGEEKLSELGIQVKTNYPNRSTKRKDWKITQFQWPVEQCEII